jgi:hypothetical protein
MEKFKEAKKLIDSFSCIRIYLSESQNLSLIEGDVFCAGSALFYSLKKMGKKANLFFKKTPKGFEFLANSKLVISVNTEEKDVSELFYEKSLSNLRISLTSSGETISPENVSFLSQNFLQGDGREKPELLISLGSKALEEIGSGFEQNPDLFYKTPLLNIDNETENQNFGEVNLVDIKSSSICEICTSLINSFGEDIIDENIATLLLAGIIWRSENFRNSKTKPETFKTASFLIEKGGNHQKIIQNFYKTKSLSQIKLLGQVLKKLSFNREKGFYSANLTEQDFKDSQSSSKDLSQVLQELKFSFGPQILTNFLVLWESHASPPLIKGIFYSPNQGLIRKLLENFEGVSRGRTVLFLIREKEMEEAYQKFMEII